MVDGKIEERVLLTPVLGAHNEGPLSYLLEVDQTRILLDCGWTDAMDCAELEPLRKIFPTVDVILVSFGDMAHMGALPYAMREFGMGENCAVRCTKATKELGLRMLYDAYLSRATHAEFNLFDLDDIDALEKKISDEGKIQFVGKSVSKIVITPILAGRILGGCLWKIVREPDEILYAVDFSVGKDSLLDGIHKKVAKLRPTLLITDAFNYQVSSNMGLKQRNDEFCKRILNVLRRNKNVIVPTDCAGRILELLYVLNGHWKQNSLTYPLVWITSQSGILDVAQFNMTEFMNADITDQFNRTRKNPFDSLAHVQIASSVEQANAVRDPKVILASSGTMESGPIRDLLLQYGPQDGHMFLFTERTMYSESLTHKLIQHLKANNTDFLPSANYTINEFKMSNWVYKTGQELVLWRMQRKERLAAEARKRQQQEEQLALRGDIAMDGMDVYTIIGDIPQEVGIEKDITELQPSEGQQTKGLINRQTSLQRQPSSQILEDDARTGGGLYSVFAQKGQASKAMFSAFEPERIKRWDEYGEILNDDDFLIVNREGGDETKMQPEEDESDSDEDSDVGPDDTEVEQDQEGDGEKDSGKKKKKKKYGNPVEDAHLSREKRDRLPRECVVRTTKLLLRCAIAFVDLESRATLTDSRNIFKMLNPRKVLIVHGSAEGTSRMVEACHQYAIQTVLAPKVGEIADVSSDVGMWRVELDKGLFDSTYVLYSHPRAIALQSKKRKTSSSDVVGIRYIEGIVGTQEGQIPLIQALSSEQASVMARTLEPQFVHSNVNRGDILRRLQEHDETAAETDKINPQLQQLGVIACKDSVSVSVEDGGERLLVEGPASRTFFKVRKLVYQSYELV